MLYATCERIPSFIFVLNKNIEISHWYININMMNFLHLKKSNFVLPVVSYSDQATESISDQLYKNDFKGLRA